MLRRAARLLFPALRWHAETGFGHEHAAIEQALAAGAGGFIVFGGNAGAVRELTESLQSRSALPLLIGSDLERGAGQQFAGATPLPPLAAIGYLDDLTTTRAAGELTGREARALGINWIYAPDADLDIETENPIIGTRSFGGEPVTVAKHVGAWVDGCHAAGVLATAKHFPGHGRTTRDSHTEQPRVDASRTDLDVDLTPFRSAIAHRVDAIMTAHVSYPALDVSGTPATLSRSIVTDLLRTELRFNGLVVTDAINMKGVTPDDDQGEAAVRALIAGVDCLLYPTQFAAVLDAIDAAVAGARLPQKRIDESIERIEAAVARPSEPNGLWGLDRDRDWALDLGLRAVHIVRGQPQLNDGAIRLLTIDDDLGGPHPAPPRDDFARTLIAAGFTVEDVQDGGKAGLIAVYCDIRGWKGRAALAPALLDKLNASVDENTTVVLFGHPRLAGTFRGNNVMSAWGGEPLMQQAAALWLHKAKQA